MPFSMDEIERYSRQIQLPEWGAVGQEALRGGCFMVFGGGDAAHAAALYLAAAGAGTILCDCEAWLEDARAINPHVRVGVPASPSREGGSPVAVAWRGSPSGPQLLIEGAADRAAVGAAVAVEGLKAALGLPHRARVDFAPIA